MNSVKKCVLVTGASRGLGLALIHALLADGYRVATCSRHLSDRLGDLREIHSEDRLFWEPCTIGDENEETAFFESVQAWSDGSLLYGLVNNAAVALDGILASFPNVESERILQVNLLGALRMSRLFLRHALFRRSSGRIVNVSSIIGSRGYTGLAAYSASKAGLDGLTRALAREVGRREITVNSVAPGYLETEMSSTLSGDQRQRIVNRTPMGRLGTVDDIVPVICFLLSKDSAFMTGQTLIVDGGITS